ncbi:hypothetical protein F7725_017308 [Dissostichus mawsoni]|uniref:Uncharacterized protein n=1 Tax=Dissostichus mawsoni TaxID=36200 RepID=A0A7J5Z416_DISMA|nr:hypothetical protein F7725_017308 [Dissostichus mawsoni]
MSSSVEALVDPGLVGRLVAARARAAWRALCKDGSELPPSSNVSGAALALCRTRPAAPPPSPPSSELAASHPPARFSGPDKTPSPAKDVGDIISLGCVLSMPPLLLLQVCNDLKQTQRGDRDQLGQHLLLHPPAVAHHQLENHQRVGGSGGTAWLFELVPDSLTVPLQGLEGVAQVVFAIALLDEQLFTLALKGGEEGESDSDLVTVCLCLKVTW